MRRNRKSKVKSIKRYVLPGYIVRKHWETIVEYLEKEFKEQYEAGTLTKRQKTLYDRAHRNLHARNMEYGKIDIFRRLMDRAGLLIPLKEQALAEMAKKNQEKTEEELKAMGGIRVDVKPNETQNDTEIVAPLLKEGKVAKYRTFDVDSKANDTYSDTQKEVIRK